MFKTPSEVSLPCVQSLGSLRPCRAASHSTYVQSPAALPPLTRRESEPDKSASVLSLGRPAQQGIIGYSGAEVLTSIQPQEQSRPPCSRLHLESEGAESLTLTSAGEFFLVRTCEQSKNKQLIVSHGSITLPAGAGPETFHVDKQVFKGQKLVEAHVSWSSNSSCVARMSIYSSEIASSRYDWCKVRLLARNYRSDLICMAHILGIELQGYDAHALRDKHAPTACISPGERNCACNV